MNRHGVRLTRRDLVSLLGAAAATRVISAWATEPSLVAPQPYFASVNRALDALARLGTPVSVADGQRIRDLTLQNDVAAVDSAEAVLSRYTLADVAIEGPESLRMMPGKAPRTLVEQGWRVFLVRMANPQARTDKIWFSSGWSTPGQMAPGAGHGAQRADLADMLNKAPAIEKMWLLAQMYESTPISVLGLDMYVVALSGAPVEYGVIQLFSRDRGRRRHDLAVYSVTATGDGLGAYGHHEFTFDCLPSRTVMLGVLDVDGRGCTAALTIRDRLEHVYPPQAMRLAPDMFFQPQIYRADGENLLLPDGEYIVESMRGPEYLPAMQTVVINADTSRIDVKLQRWIDPAAWGWFSGDTHIHAAGCAHYQNPTEGVSPETIIRHVRGEGLSIGDVLTWGPSWYYQKQFFSGQAASPPSTLEHPDLQAANSVTLQPRATATDADSMLRYDVEVSGFPSSHAGHLVLLRLTSQDYPGTKVIEDWPSWNLPILKWAKEQGAVCGYSHCGIGMVVDAPELPNYEIPPMDGIGTQEAIMDVTHGVCDFLSGMNTHPVAELNAWYHMLNCGFRLAMVGETDWPCITGDRVGAGRSYVRLDHRPVDNAGYEAWIRGLKEGRLYCGDGRSHFLEFSVNGRSSGDDDLLLDRPGLLHIEALVAARLEPEISAQAIPRRVMPGWGWHIEWARIGTTREVPVELIVNGIAVERTTLLADGAPRPIKFKTRIHRSSWVSLRILPSAHAHPVFVRVDGKPIRASKRSAQWCRACVDKVWEVKSPFMRASERPDAAQAFDHARAVYDRIIQECEVA